MLLPSKQRPNERPFGSDQLENTVLSEGISLFRRRFQAQENSELIDLKIFEPPVLHDAPPYVFSLLPTPYSLLLKYSTFLWVSSVCAFPEQNDGYSCKHDLEVKEQRLVLDVIEIQKNHFLESDMTSAGNLPESWLQGSSID